MRPRISVDRAVALITISAPIYLAQATTMNRSDTSVGSGPPQKK
jgi:hypothetical protein